MTIIIIASVDLLHKFSNKFFVTPAQKIIIMIIIIITSQVKSSQVKSSQVNELVPWLIIKLHLSIYMNRCSDAWKL